MRQTRQDLILLAVFTVLLGIACAELFRVLGDTKRNVSSIVGAKYEMQQANSKLGNRQQAASCTNTPSQNNTKKLLNLKAQLEHAMINIDESKVLR